LQLGINKKAAKKGCKKLKAKATSLHYKTDVNKAFPKIILSF
jgi:hypothetical protein